MEDSWERRTRITYASAGPLVRWPHRLGKQVRFEILPRDELPSRLTSVLEVIYLLFNEGYWATADQDWMRPSLAQAMRLGRVLAGLMAAEGEVHGLVALMELQASRAWAPAPARRASRSC